MTPHVIAARVLDLYMLPARFAGRIIMRKRQPVKPNVLEFTWRSDDLLDKEWLAQFLMLTRDVVKDWMVIDLRGFHRHKNMHLIGRRSYENTDERGEPTGTRTSIYNVTQFPVGILVAANDRTLAAIAAANPYMTHAMLSRQAGTWANGHPYGRD